MHSFTSSSERIAGGMRWASALGAAFAIAAGIAALLEFQLAERGYRPTVVDSTERWIRQRDRASELGSKALILIGASRIQLAVDLAAARRESALEPVQLAIDGATFEPILSGLADDPAITGTIVVDYYDSLIGSEGGVGQQYQEAYAKAAGRRFASPYETIEADLTEQLRSHLAVYADGANPINSVLQRILPKEVERSYLQTLPDRSRMADYSLVQMPDFYYMRVLRQLGVTPPPEGVSVAGLHAAVEALTPLDDKVFMEKTRELKKKIARIEARGGRVMFVALPTSGLVKDIETKRYPRALFWDRFVKEVGVKAVRTEDLPELRDVVSPDGSHVDMRDRERVTQAVMRALGLSRQTSH